MAASLSFRASGASGHAAQGPQLASLQGQAPAPEMAPRVPLALQKTEVELALRRSALHGFRDDALISKARSRRGAVILTETNASRFPVPTG